VILCDNVTGEWATRAVSVGKRDLTLECVEMLKVREAVPDFTLCAGLLKKDRFDLVLEKACELGVRHIQPVLTRRCVADKLNLDRARATLIEAAEQCARTALPRLRLRYGLMRCCAIGIFRAPCSLPTNKAARPRSRVLRLIPALRPC
jgi:16S rRNA (uracil1498-N3)-methyltransferase